MKISELASKPGVLYGLRLPGATEYRYVGITTNFVKRSGTHRRRARSGFDLPVYRWMRKHGVDSIVFDVIEEHPDRASLCAAEVAMIARIRASRSNLLNMTNGGDGGSGYRHTEEWKAKLRAIPKEQHPSFGKKRDPEHMRMMSRKAAQSWTPERRAAHSIRVREQWAKRKAEQSSEAA